MKEFSLPKARLLTKTWEYDRVYRQGKRLRGNHFTLILAAGDRSVTRLGISVHGVKQAVRRNRIKRIVREFFRLHGALLPSAVDMVFAVRKDFIPNSPDEVREAVQQLLTAGSAPAQRQPKSAGANQPPAGKQGGGA